jgi:Icc-related predicted phosphoesterase
MKILHIADLHLRQDWLDWAASQAPAFDLLVIAGDLLDLFSKAPIGDQARTVTKWLLALRTPTVVCSGNHDFWVNAPGGAVDAGADGEWLRQLRKKGRIVATDGDVVDLGGRRFAVNGWLQVPQPDASVDILICHSPPMGCACARGVDGSDNGDPELWNALEYNPPGLLLAGHVHAPAKTWDRWPQRGDPSTLVLVPGCREDDPTPSHWIINTTRRTAMHSEGEVVGY